MDTIGEIRRRRLTVLRDHFGSTAALLRALHRNTRDATISQILTGARDSKTGKPRQMGSVLARHVEVQLALPVGWMDQPGPAALPFPPTTTRLATNQDVADYHEGESLLIAGFRAASPEVKKVMLSIAQDALDNASPLANARRA